MMVQTLLCQSPAVSSAITAAVDMLGGIGSDYALGPQCKSSSAVPFLKLHGTADPSITYDKQILVDGVNFLSAIEATQQRAKHNGCSANDAGPETTEADGKMKCTDYCGKAAGKPTAKVCGMLGVGHTTDFPHPGFVFEQAWLFFEQQAKLAAAKLAAVRAVPVQKGATAAKHATKSADAAAAVAQAKAAGAAQAKAAAAAAGRAKGPLQLQMIYPGEHAALFQVLGSSVVAITAACALQSEFVNNTQPMPFQQAALAGPCTFSTGLAGSRLQANPCNALYCLDEVALWWRYVLQVLHCQSSGPTWQASQSQL
jgi:hypothetical protein